MNDLKLAAQIIKDGGVVAFPTETVYGLGADATNDEACQKIYKLKARPATIPLIVHVANIADARKIGIFSSNAMKVAEAFWPGPISIVVPLQKEARISSTVTAGLSTIALRVPANDIAIDLIQCSGLPIAAPSANPSGYISPTQAIHVQEHFAAAGVMVLDGEASYIGIESTIIDFSVEQPTILRQGFITAEAIEEVIGETIGKLDNSTTLKAPGMMEKHYSPHVGVRLNADTLEDNEIGLGFGKISFAHSYNLSMNGDLIEAASNLYAYLRELDKQAVHEGYARIAISPIPHIGVGIAINDRLKRASTK